MVFAAGLLLPWIGSVGIVWWERERCQLPAVCGGSCGGPVLNCVVAVCRVLVCVDAEGVVCAQIWPYELFVLWVRSWHC